MSRYIPSMIKYCWIIIVCFVIALGAGIGLAKAQPAEYTANATMIVNAGAQGTTFPGASNSSNDSIGKSTAYVTEIPTSSVMAFVYQFDPVIKQHNYSVDDLASAISASNPSTTTPTILVTSTTDNPRDAVLLVNDTVKGYKAFKDKQMQDQLKALQQNYQNQYDAFKKQRDTLDAKIASLSTTDPHYSLATSDRQSLTTSMNSVQNQMIQLPPTVQSDVFILQEAKNTDAYSASKTVLIVGASAAIGFSLGLVIWLFVIFLDNRLRSEDQVPEKLGLNLLGSLSNNKDVQAGSVPTSGPAAQQLSDIGVNLRLTGVLTSPGHAPQGSVLLVTSARPVEGKTTVATGLAAAAARGGRSVLVIDGNLSQPTTHLAFGISPSSFGLSGLLRAANNDNLDNAVQRTNLPNVWLLSGGTSIEDAPLLLEQRLPGILAQLRKKIDWIIIDGSSVLSSASASLLASMSDGVLLVVDARHDRIALLLRAKEVLRSLTHTPIGVVMNRLRARHRNPYYAATYVTEESSEAKVMASHQGSSNGNSNGGGLLSNAQQVNSATSPFSLSNPPSRPGTMPMDLPVMQSNPPSPFPAPRRMDMMPPQS